MLFWRRHSCNSSRIADIPDAPRLERLAIRRLWDMHPVTPISPPKSHRTTASLIIMFLMYIFFAQNANAQTFQETVEFLFNSKEAKRFGEIRIEPASGGNTVYWLSLFEYGVMPDGNCRVKSNRETPYLNRGEEKTVYAINYVGTAPSVVTSMILDLTKAIPNTIVTHKYGFDLAGSSVAIGQQKPVQFERTPPVGLGAVAGTIVSGLRSEAAFTGEKVKFSLDGNVPSSDRRASAISYLFKTLCPGSSRAF